LSSWRQYVAKDKSNDAAAAPAEVTPDPTLDAASGEEAVEDPSAAAGEAGQDPSGEDLVDADLSGEEGEVIDTSDPDADIIDDESGEITNVRAGSILEDPDQDGVAAGSSEFSGGGEAVEEDEGGPSLRGLSKTSLQAQAAAAGLPTDGTKDEIAQRITDAGIEIVQPKGANGCLSDPDCIRPQHESAPAAHAYGLQTETTTAL
jgi:hypothetical protein